MLSKKDGQQHEEWIRFLLGASYSEPYVKIDLFIVYLHLMPNVSVLSQN